MKRSKNLWLHFLFWIVYFSISLFTELYLSSSMSHAPSFELISQAARGQLLLLVIKMAAVYYTIYFLIPRWLNEPLRFRFYVEAFLALCIFIAAYRAMMHFVIWPYISRSAPASLTTLQFTARLFYSVFDLLQVVGIASAIKLFRLRIAAIKNEKALIQEKLQSEMVHLRSQMNPHFLFNMLNSIYALSRSNSPDTPGVIMKLSKILHFMLHETNKKTIPIEQELKIIEDYIALQSLRFGNRIKVVFKKQVDDNSAPFTPLLLFPLVENAFKHGNTEEDAVITLNIELLESILNVEVVNVIGNSSVRNSGEEGIGLPNLHRQLKLLYRDFSFTHEKRGQSFYVVLRINLASYAGFELFDSRR